MHQMTPESSIAIQENLGADIIMAFDECAPPYDRAYSEQAMVRTHAWAERCLRAQKRSDQALFGILQGGAFADLRARSAQAIASLNFVGHAIGGLSVGERKADMHAMIEVANAILPKEKPRYLMGVGAPDDLVNGVLRGIDMFDCVLPTRLARHQAAMTPTGRLNLLNSAFSRDERPVVAGCTCYTCQHFSRAYLRHLFIAKEMLAATLLSIHNIHTLLQLTRDMRQAVIDQRYSQFASQFLSQYSARAGKQDDPE
jgi:queuine tRNA-ribosyltransferase